jgi:DNA-binding transcriptional ArsR family regulator
MQQPSIEWELSSGYEMFISLMVLNDPEYFGQRPAWAAGVRARLPAAARKELESGGGLLSALLCWAANQPRYSNAASLLAAFAAIAPELRLPTITAYCVDEPATAYATLVSIAQGPKPGPTMREWAPAHWAKALKPADATSILKLWEDPIGFAERYLAALQAYYELFYAEEELRITPIMAKALADAQALSEQLTLLPLLEQLTRGLDMSDLIVDATHLRLAPSYWATPIMIGIGPTLNELLIFFGARPLGAALAPGEAVPEPLVDALKALADPTRLAILRELGRESLLPTQLGLRLRLRTATISHHLKMLRLAGLVRIRVEQGTERYYAGRPEGLAEAYAALRAYLSTEN